MLSPEAFAAIMALSREQLIEKICASGYIAPLPAEQQGKYLFGKTVYGKTQSDRAVCLAWGDEQEDGRVTYDLVFGPIYDEIVQAKLKIPFIVFGCTCSVFSSDTFTFCQIPWFFEERTNPVLSLLRTMSLQTQLHVANPVSEDSWTALAERTELQPVGQVAQGTAMEKTILTRRQAEIAMLEAGIIGFTKQGHRYCVWHAIDRIYEGNWRLPLALALDEVSVLSAPNGNEVTPILSDTVACEACAEERGPTVV